MASSQHLKCFNKRMLELFEDIEGVKVIMDDGNKIRNNMISD